MTDHPNRPLQVPRASNVDQDLTREAIELDAANLRDAAFGFALSRMRCPFEADDVANETMIRLQRAPPPVIIKHIKAWVLGAAYRVMQEFRRKNKQFRSVDPGTIVVSCEHDIGDDIDRRQLMQRIQEATKNLAPLDREVIRLRVDVELSNVATARMLGICQNAASMRFSRAKARMADKIRGSSRDQDDQRGPNL